MDLLTIFSSPTYPPICLSCLSVFHPWLVFVLSSQGLGWVPGRIIQHGGCQLYTSVAYQVDDASCLTLTHSHTSHILAHRCLTVFYSLLPSPSFLSGASGRRQCDQCSLRRRQDRTTRTQTRACRQACQALRSLRYALLTRDTDVAVVALLILRCLLICYHIVTSHEPCLLLLTDACMYLWCRRDEREDHSHQVLRQVGLRQQRHRGAVHHRGRGVLLLRTRGTVCSQPQVWIPSLWVHTPLFFLTFSHLLPLHFTDLATL